MGLIQHYFTTKDEMLLFAFGVMSARVERRIGAAVSALPQPPTTRSLLRVLLSTMVPIDEDSLFEAPLWVAFLARAVVEPGLGGRLRDNGKALLDFVAGQLHTAQQAGEIAEDLDPEMEAVSLLALSDGLMIRALIETGRTASPLAALDYHLDRIFGTAGRGPAPG